MILQTLEIALELSGTSLKTLKCQYPEFIGILKDDFLSFGTNWLSTSAFGIMIIYRLFRVSVSSCLQGNFRENDLGFTASDCRLHYREMTFYQQ